jgi:Ca2+-binding RTX toxin-like protein
MYPTPRSVRRWALVAAVPLAVALAAPAATSGAAENAPADDPVATARRIMNGTQVDNTINSVPPGAPTMGDCFGTYVSSDPAVIYADPNDEYTFGTGGDDIIIGSDDYDSIWGLGGDDRICAGGGNDYVESGYLPDRSPVTGEYTSGDDGEDEDRIDGGTGIDVLHGSDGPDWIYGGPNDVGGLHDWLYAEGGDDHLFGERGPDVLLPGAGQDYCDGGTGVAPGWPEDDSVVGTCDPILNVP